MGWPPRAPHHGRRYPRTRLMRIRGRGNHVTCPDRSRTLPRPSGLFQARPTRGCRTLPCSTRRLRLLAPLQLCSVLRALASNAREGSGAVPPPRGRGPTAPTPCARLARGRGVGRRLTLAGSGCSAIQRRFRSTQEAPPFPSPRLHSRGPTGPGQLERALPARCYDTGNAPSR